MKVKLDLVLCMLEKSNAITNSQYESAMEKRVIREVSFRKDYFILREQCKQDLERGISNKKLMSPRSKKKRECDSESDLRRSVHARLWQFSKRLRRDDS